LIFQLTTGDSKMNRQIRRTPPADLNDRLQELRNRQNLRRQQDPAQQQEEIAVTKRKPQREPVEDWIFRNYHTGASYLAAGFDGEEIGEVITALSFPFWRGFPDDGVRGVGTDDYARCELIILFLLQNDVDVNAILVDRVIQIITHRSRSYPQPTRRHLDLLLEHIEMYTEVAKVWISGTKEYRDLDRNQIPLIERRHQEIHYFQYAAVRLFNTNHSEGVAC
jgi:hypothetical protein